MNVSKQLAAALVGLVALGGPCAQAAPPPAGELVIADFDTGRKPNNLGGDFGVWIKDPGDPMQGCIENFDRANRYGDKGNALRLIYSVASNRPAFGGLWMKLQGLDATPYDHLVLRVKGDKDMGFTTRFKLEIKDALGQASRYQIEGVTDQWQEFTVPLNEFVGMANRRKLAEFVVIFEDNTATARQGVIYLDDVRLGKAGG